MARQSAKKRTATISRETGETKISVALSLDGRGKFEIKTGSKMFDHMLTHIAQHGLFDIKIKASGWDQHHVVEDVAIALGQALKKALGDKKGITRMGHAIVPMDEALALVAVDISGRGYAVMDASFKRKKIGDLETDMVRHFLETFAQEAKMNLHVKVPSGTDDHHKAEALFKALGRALDSATKIDARLAGRVPST
ncbi:MAG: imidazoleglycerol-phosphate dehydratase HisB, partial [Dehalococcoidia bacterium]|nr:imidazoleglycerol-phosphate dehydratase HisB [Dehalococcoidia bacterium]